jgi:hypothetical protein
MKAFMEFSNRASFAFGGMILFGYLFMVIFDNIGLNGIWGGFLGIIIGNVSGYIIGHLSDKKAEKNETLVYTQKELDDEWFAATHIDCANYLTDGEFEMLQGLHQKIKLLKDVKEGKK